MKTTLIASLLLALAFGFGSCKSMQETTATPNAETSIRLDSTEYQVIIMDNNFDRWYITNFSQSRDRSNSFYLSKNNLAVSNWNYYFTTNRYNRIINNYIAYNPTQDYGLEANRKLYWYFKYIEETYRVPLLR